MALLLVDFLRKRNQKNVLYRWKIALSLFYKGRFQGRTLSVSLRSTALPKGEPLAERESLILIGQLLEEANL